VGLAVRFQKIIFKEKSEAEDGRRKNNQREVFQPAQPDGVSGFTASGRWREGQRVGCEIGEFVCDRAVTIIAFVHDGLGRPNRKNRQRMACQKVLRRMLRSKLQPPRSKLQGNIKLQSPNPRKAAKSKS